MLYLDDFFIIFWNHNIANRQICFHEQHFNGKSIKHISHQSEFWHLIFQKWLIFSKFFGDYQSILMLNALYKRNKDFTYEFYSHTNCRKCGRGTLWCFPLVVLGSVLHNMWTWNSNCAKIHNVPSLYCLSTFLALFWPTHKLEPDAQNLRLINGHFLTISSRFFAKYMNIFHKTEVQTIILRCWTNTKNAKTQKMKMEIIGFCVITFEPIKI